MSFSSLSLSLVVLRVSDIEKSVAFYSVLGLTFTPEQHGNGPKHFSMQFGPTVFELYPATQRSPVSPVRLGFTVPAMTSALEAWQSMGGSILSDPTQSSWGLRAVIADPDGHVIELTQQSLPHI